MFLCRFLLVAVLASICFSAVVYVDYAVDNTPSVNDCLPSSTGSCNFRSAWAACSSLPAGNMCIIELPVATKLGFDTTTYGTLKLSDTTNVTVNGYSTTFTTPAGIQATGPVSTDSYYYYYTPSSSSAPLFTYQQINKSTKPKLSFTNVSFVGLSNPSSYSAVIAASGSIELNFYSVSFTNNTAYGSADIFVVYNLHGQTNFYGCLFKSGIGTGGAIGGGSMVFYNASNIQIINSEFRSNEGDTGAILFEYASNVHIQSTIFDGNTGDNSAGSIEVYSCYNVLLDNITISNSYSPLLAGGLYISNYNEQIIITNSRFLTTSTGYRGGCIAFDAYNTNTYIINTLFQGCTCSYYGAAMNIEQYNSAVIVYNSTFLNAFATSTSLSTNGGVARVGISNVNIYFTDVHIRNVFANQGGSFYIYQSNDQVYLNNITVHNSNASGNGGVIRFYDGNTNVQITSMHVTGAYANFYGGVIQMRNNHQNIVIEHCVFQYVRGTVGGMIYIGQQNSNILLSKNVFSFGTATVSHGGGIYIDSSNDQIMIIENTISHCTAVQNGGGIYLGSDNTGVSIVGTQILSNSAGISGGGIYSQLNNPQLTLIDSDGYRHSNIWQTSHPYSSAYTIPRYVIFNQTMTFPTSCTVILVFDPLTEIYSLTDTLYIYKQANTLVFQSVDDTTFPGTTLPAKIIHDVTSLQLIFYGPTSSTYAPTSITQKIWGFKLYITPIFANASSPTVIAGNTASESGGGFYAFGNLAFSTWGNVVMEKNIAKQSSGGGMYIRDAIVGLTLQSVSFISNACMFNGGGIYFSSASYGCMISDSQFHYNNATEGNGGALYFVTDNGDGVLSSGNEIGIYTTSIANNSAENGGGMYADSVNHVVVKDCYIGWNAAIEGNGGGMYFNSKNTITVSQTHLDTNTADFYGGGIYLANVITINIDSSVFAGNRAVYLGGGMSINYNSIVTFSEDIIFRNNYGGLGGALAVRSAPLWVLSSSTTNLQLTGNAGGRGSAMFFYSLVSSGSSLKNINVTYNQATIGGTVYWIIDATMTVEPPGLSAVSWHGNTAPYGVKVATQAVQLIGPQQYTVEVYNQALFPYISFHLMDHYRQFIPLDSPSTTVTVSITANAVKAAKCYTVHPYLAGDNLIGTGVTVANGGYAVFNNLQVYCSPHGNVTLEFEARLGDLTPVPTQLASSYYLKNQTFLQFRSCQAGEYQLNGACYVCPPGSYSLFPDSLSCDDCTQTNGVSQCYANQIVLNTGYWRRYPYTKAVLVCPTGSSCQGGNVTGDSLCAEGYEGPLCNVCSDGYYSYNGGCAACSGSNLFSPTFIVVIVLGFVLLLCFWGIYLYNAAFMAITSTFHITNSFDQLLAMIYDLYVWLKQQQKSIMIRLKIIVSTFQIVTVTSTIFAVSIPLNLDNFFNSFRFLNLRLTTMFPVGCATANFDFIENMILTTLFPIGLTLVLIMTMFGEYYVSLYLSYQRKEFIDKDLLFQIMKNKYLNYVFYLTYLILPSVTTTIFQIFICTNIDPQNESGGDDYYLTADMSISCTSAYYYEGVTYAVAMIFVYPLGIPLLYLALLYVNRQEIMDRNLPPLILQPDEVKGTEGEQAIELKTFSSANSKNTNNDDHIKEIQDEANDDEGFAAENPMHEGKTTEKINDENGSPKETMKQSSVDLAAKNLTMTTSSGRVLSPSTTRVAFLWSAYEPQYWYWEIIDTTRRLFLTAVLSVCAPGTSGQNVLSMLLALTYIKVYSHFQPYDKFASDVLAEIGQFQIFFTFFGAMIFQNNLLADSVLDLVGGSLVVLNMSVVVTAIRFQWLDYIEIRKKAGLTELSFSFFVGFWMVGRGTAPAVSTATVPSDGGNTHTHNQQPNDGSVSVKQHDADDNNNDDNNDDHHSKV